MLEVLVNVMNYQLLKGLCSMKYSECCVITVSVWQLSFCFSITLQARLRQCPLLPCEAVVCNYLDSHTHISICRVQLVQ
jgi:hypothetical protein